MKTILYIGNQFPGSVMIDLGQHLEKDFVVKYASSKPNKLFRMLDMCGTFFRLRRQVDIVIIDTYSTLNFWYAWVISQLCRLFKKPYISFLHGGDLPNRIRRTPKMANAIFSHSIANVAPSAYLQFTFERQGYSTHLIPNFIDLEKYPFQLRIQLRPNFLWVRSFEKIYHPDMTIRVFNEVQKIYPDAQLCMVGHDKDGSLKICKQLVFELGLEQQVRFTGRLPKKEWIALSTDYDIFISTTHFDNTPVSIMEAMALGLPVISTDVGGVPFLLEHGQEGLLSPDSDLPAMLANINRLLTDAHFAKKLSQNAREKAETLDWDVVKKRWFELLNLRT